MIAVRSIHEVVAGSVTIRLPVDFAAKRVEVIILPVEEAQTKPSQLQRLLLAAPTISEAELDEFAQTREWMNRWHTGQQSTDCSARSSHRRNCGRTPAAPAHS